MSGKKSVRRRWVVIAGVLAAAAVGALLMLSLVGGTARGVFEKTAPGLSDGSAAPGDPPHGKGHRDGAAPGLTPKGAMILDK